MYRLKIPFHIFLGFLLSCSDPHFSTTTRDINGDKKPDQIMHTNNSLQSAVFIETDSSLNGKMEDFLWVNGDNSDIQNSAILFNLVQKNGKTKSKTWYGPSNIKLIEKVDEDEDGYLESTIYYNRFALPKAIQGIVARIEIKSVTDDKTSIWIYPGNRMELDKNSDGIPDCYTVDLAEINSFYSTPENWKNILRIACKSLSADKSFVISPNIIVDEKLKSILPSGLFE